VRLGSVGANERLVAFDLRLRLDGSRVWGINNMRITGIVALGAALGGCASSAEDITPAYISPVISSDLASRLEPDPYPFHRYVQYGRAVPCG
jgi:hypothetical protein